MKPNKRYFCVDEDGEIWEYTRHPKRGQFNWYLDCLAEGEHQRRIEKVYDYQVVLNWFEAIYEIDAPIPRA